MHVAAQWRRKIKTCTRAFSHDTYSCYTLNGGNEHVLKQYADERRQECQGEGVNGIRITTSPLFQPCSSWGWFLMSHHLHSIAKTKEGWCHDSSGRAALVHKPFASYRLWRKTKTKTSNVKFSLHAQWRHIGVWEAKAPIIHNFGTTGNCLLHQMNRSFGGPRRQSGRWGEEKRVLSVPRFESPIVQFVALLHRLY